MDCSDERASWAAYHYLEQPAIWTFVQGGDY